MNNQKYRSHSSSNDLVKNLNNFILKQKELKNKIEKYNRYFNQIKIEIIKSIIKYKLEFCRNQDFWKNRIKHLRMRRAYHENLLKTIREASKNIQKPELDGELANQIRFLKYQIEKINEDTNKLERKIKFMPLDINQENKFIDKIHRLKKKKKYLSYLIKQKEREQIFLFENSEYCLILNKIKFLKRYLDYLQLELKKWSEKRKKSHLAVLNLYRKMNELSLNKKRLGSEFIEIKFSNEKFKEFFYEILNNEKNILKEKITSSSKEEQVNLQPNNLQSNEKRKNNWLVLQKYKRQKLAIALQKKKTGKKLDFYELKLILENTKKL